MISVGIDIGTSTTKCIFSRLEIERCYGASVLPQFKITGRKVIYESPMYSTPLLSDVDIDHLALHAILAGEYERAGLQPEDVDTGAVIITGETAVKHNADQIVHYLARFAGKFVVAQAGGDLEAVLAGKGSGAEARSLEIAGQVVNIDIGGGTANCAFFAGGSCARTINFHVGGRLIRLDSQGKVLKLFPVIAEWMSREGYGLEEGDLADLEQLREITGKWSDMLLDTILNPRDPKVCPLVYGQPEEITGTAEPVSELWVSGGVGLLLEHPGTRSLAEAVRFGDIGPLLAESLVKAAANYSIKLRTTPEAQRATVIGAGVHTTSLSGSTVFVDSGLLPLRNIPVVKLSLPEQAEGDLAGLAAAVENAFAEGKRRFGTGVPADLHFAVSIPGCIPETYPVIRRIASAAAEASLRNGMKVIILICENDIAKAVGNVIHLLTRGEQRCICLDQIAVRHGDYIDIGYPLDGDCIPVAVKTLVFQP
ncbi:ethanolamine ammonia-lyase reactivating factor EutA [Paenibacillus tianjinensis]|uniref:Ethanolamine ammonia-lyase reactivating factor EutA n=1 Tax=Paenibacillus tianjinensis TaxID=2810347 RepID=A0ABX7LJ72_9BACL|nr:ethanolamine ammonia-lyase reactivating factor EutA [Paenibacillus tianjinensis]QSF47029.1 ethanolamine ammonia-lyase reactivating factor EutA [Paenibacillus tianjinensis]